jgi:hypothetical protein
MAERLSFERERLRYCEAMYSLEKERRQVIERHAQFYLGAITLFLGILSLKSEVVKAVSDGLSRSGSLSGAVAIQCCIALFVASVTASLVSIGVVFAPERRAKPYPRDLVTQMFSGERETKGAVGQIGELLEADLLEENAMRFAIAAERNSLYNTKKARWLVVAAMTSLSAVLSYLLLAVATLGILL